MREIKYNRYEIKCEDRRLVLYFKNKRLYLDGGTADSIHLYRQDSYLCVYGFNLNVGYYYLDLYDYFTFISGPSIYTDDYKLPDLLGCKKQANLFRGNTYIIQAKKLYNIINQW